MSMICPFLDMPCQPGMYARCDSCLFNSPARKRAQRVPAGKLKKHARGEAAVMLFVALDWLTIGKLFPLAWVPGLQNPTLRRS